MTLPRFDGRFNMAEDERLLGGAEAGQVGWRVYGWEGPWVSLGHYQSPERDLLDPEVIPWVMRPTGGKAVLHGHDETVGLAWPLESLSENPDVGRSIRTVYRLAIAPILSALRQCGVDAVLGEALPGTRLPAVRTADCFAHVSPNDIVEQRTGVKVCGCALKLTRLAVLVQASIPAGPPLIDPAKVFAHPAHLPWIRWDHLRFGEAFAEQMRREPAIA